MWNHVISKLHISASPSCKDLPPLLCKSLTFSWGPIGHLSKYLCNYKYANISGCSLLEDGTKLHWSLLQLTCNKTIPALSRLSLAVRTQKPVLQAASDSSDGEAGLVENTVGLTPTNDQPILSACYQLGVLRRFSNGTGEGADFMLCAQTLKALFYRR